MTLVVARDRATDERGKAYLISKCRCARREEWLELSDGTQVDPDGAGGFQARTGEKFRELLRAD